MRPFPASAYQNPLHILGTVRLVLSLVVRLDDESTQADIGITGFYYEGEFKRIFLSSSYSSKQVK